MNKLYVVNDEIEKQELDDSIEVETLLKNELFTVNSIRFHVTRDTQLLIHYDILEKMKLNISFVVDPNVSFTLYEEKTGVKSKIGYEYTLGACAKMEVFRLHLVFSAREYDQVHLNGEASHFRMVLKTVAVDREKYDMVIHHHAKQTKSDIINQGISREKGKISFGVTSIIPKGNTMCEAHQTSRIINLNHEENEIKPNLLVDEYDVDAAHAAFIGTLREEEIFYLQSRGLTLSQAKSLLLKGFLCSYLEDTPLFERIEKLKYGR